MAPLKIRSQKGHMGPLRPGPNGPTERENIKMVAWFSKWAQGIIVAVIIATIIEMILPNGSSKKYVKVVIGIYILFTIISPIISKLSNKIDINEFLNTEKYEQIFAKSDENISQKVEKNNNKTIKDIYISNLETDIKSKLLEKGYGVSSTYIKIKNDDTYALEELKIDLYKKTSETSETSETKESKNNISVNKVEIQVDKKSNNITSNQVDISQINENEKNELKEYLSKTYNINANNIEIS